MYRYDSYHAFLILTEIWQENSFGWAAIGLPMSSPAQLRRVTLVVPSTFNCFKSDVFLALISLTHILIIFHVVLVQKVKHLNWTLESCTWKISILWFGWRYLCILMDIYGHPISYSVVILYTLLGNLLARLCWWTTPYYRTLTYGIPISSPPPLP